MPKAKRGQKQALSREILVPLIAVVVIALIAGVIFIATQPKKLSEAEKTAARHSCGLTFKDTYYDFTTMDQCEKSGLWSEAMANCQAWVSGKNDSCKTLLPGSRLWCDALASKDPAACDAVGQMAPYCKAFVTRNPAACDSMQDMANKAPCYVTLRNDLSIVDQNSDELCGADYTPAP